MIEQIVVTILGYLITTAIGAAVAYGVVKQKVKYNDDEIKDMKRSIEKTERRFDELIGEINEKISNISIKLSDVNTNIAKMSTKLESQYEMVIQRITLEKSIANEQKKRINERLVAIEKDVLINKNNIKLIGGTDETIN